MLSTDQYQWKIKKNPNKLDYNGEKWVGRSHNDNIPGIVHHDFQWIKKECKKNSFKISKVINPFLNFGNQQWLVISKK